VVYEIKKNGQIAKDFELFRKSECKSVLCLFAIKDGTEEAIPLRKIE
jgi:hypothetical protein